jgi:hypothetical protein
MDLDNKHKERPEVKIMAVSNVYCRLMKFNKIGDYEMGHYHDYDHGTLLSKGSLKVEMFDPEGNPTGTKIFQAPTFMFIEKFKIHRLTALEEDTVAVCIHALRSIDEEIVDPDFLVEEKLLADSLKHAEESGLSSISQMFIDKGMIYKPLANKE